MTPKHSLDKNDYKSILNNMVDGIITIDQRGIILSFNKTAESLFGYKSTEVIGKNVSILMPEPERSSHDSYIQNHITTGVEKIIGIGREVTALKKSGDTFPMYLSVIEYQTGVESDRWFIGTCRDITIQKQQQEQLKRSQKMDAIGKLTSGLAHDYNNALGVILGFTELLSETMEGNPESLEYLGLIKQSAERASNLTQKLMSISRKRADFAEVISIKEILEGDELILAKTLTPQIKLKVSCDEDLWSVFIDRNCLDDAILNLSINAMHAMPEGGELSIAASNIDVSSLESQILGVVEGEYVKLSITDTGIGMTEDVVAHIFEPFYSTKGEKGTGLGLSQVYNFVSEFKGTIRVYSEPGEGTCFSIYLPRYDVEQVGMRKEDEHTENDNLDGSATILVVDDEENMRELSNKILSKHGYTVLTASGVEEALAVLENEDVDMVLSDVIMSGMDGYELAHIIRCTYPDIKIQLCSGFANVKGKSVTNEELEKNMLAKPFSSKQLLEKTRELLA